MGTSTVSGPFRSQNGFQELVNGVWTPVGGGGGGGGSIATVVPVTLGSYQPVVITKPELGTVLQFVGPYVSRNAPDTGTEFQLAPTSGYAGLLVVGISSTEAFGVERISSFPTIGTGVWQKNQAGWLAWSLNLTYMGDYENTPTSIYAAFWANYTAYNP
jgi:hypothetical protein